MTTAYNPGADEDTTAQLASIGQQAVDAGQRAHTGIARMTTDGLQGDAAAGAGELAAAVAQATESSNESVQYVNSTSNEYGDTSNGTDVQFAGVIRSGG